MDTEKILVHIDLLKTGRETNDTTVSLADSALNFLSQAVEPDTQVLAIAVIVLADSYASPYATQEQALVVYPTSMDTDGLTDMQPFDELDQILSVVPLLSIALYASVDDAIHFATQHAHKWANQFNEDPFDYIKPTTTSVNKDTGVLSDVDQNYPGTYRELEPISDAGILEQRKEQLAIIIDSAIKLPLGLLVNAIITHLIVNSETDSNLRNN